MSRYVPANSRPPASPEYVAVPGFMGNIQATGAGVRALPLILGVGATLLWLMLRD